MANQTFSFRILCRTAGLALLLAAAIWGQSDRATITGTVTDATGAVVPGAQVTATQVSTNTSVKANTTSSGDFTVPSLPVGTYQVRVERQGFKTHVRENVLLTAGSIVRVDVQLEVGATQQAVEVTASLQTLQADTARVATEVSSTLVDQLPVVVSGGVRNPFDLAAITAEVSTAGQFRIGGGRSGGWGMTLDGTSITVAGQMDGSGPGWTQVNTPSVEALTEFAVESGGFKAETGHASGGSMTFVSKSGTNTFHGSAYEFLRNEKLDARGFFAARRAVYKQNDFGFTAGGPVRLPKIYNGRDRTFFFFSYEGFRNRVGAGATPYSIPPQEFFTGDLRNFVDAGGKMYQVYDPASQRLVGTSYVRDPFPNNQIPQNRIDPISKSIIGYVQPLLKPNVEGLVPGTSAYVRNNYISTGTSLSPANKWSFKIDQAVTQNQRVSFFFGRNRHLDDYGPSGPPGLPKPLAGNPGYNRSDVYRVSHDFTLSPTWLNRAYIGINNWRQNHGSYATFKDAPQSDGIPTTSVGWKEKGICIPNYPDCNANFPIVAFANSEFTTWGVAAPNGSENIVGEFKDDMTKTSGPHSFKGGYYYNTAHYNGFGLQNIAGNMTFNRLSTSIPLNTNQATGGGSAFAAFLLGYVSNYSLDTPRYIATSYRTHQMYFQDDWRVSRRLTLNLGLRYEINLAPVVGDDQMSDLDVKKPNPGAGNIPGALIFAGFGPGRENTRTLVDNWYGGLGPRVGFSYSLDSKTVIRGSATRSYGPITHVGSSSHNLGFVVRLTNNDTSQGLSPLWIMKDGPPAWEKPPKIDPSVGNGANAPYYNGRNAITPSGELTYAFNIQRQLTGSILAEVGYLSTLASNIQSSLLAFNQLDYRELPANLSPFTAAGRTLLNSQVGSAAANTAGIRAPWAGFNTLWGSGATVAQALRPFPQYSTIDTINGQGDRIGHSTYHALQVKVSKRSSGGLTLQGSYVLAKMLTDSDPGGGTPFDKYNRRLDKSIASYDQTHVVKLNYVYELPFGAGRKYLTNRGAVNAILGGWRFSAIHSYSSGTPMMLGTTIGFPIFNTSSRITAPTYEGWRGTISGSKFDPAVDSFLQPASFFGPQPTDRFGNVTRFNPKLRGWPGLSENVSLAKTFGIREPMRLDFRFEGFNLLNRTSFSGLSGATTLQNANYGLWRNQGNSARRMQLALKLYW
jgi:hypothetical protein